MGIGLRDHCLVNSGIAQAVHGEKAGRFGEAFLSSVLGHAAVGAATSMTATIPMPIRATALEIDHEKNNS